ncbi:GntR family transcriptional regulator [Paenibacillus sp. FSL K6-2862]|uniref:GntR family transcriptional regulator n=1 Tax=Paenibacillus sp. FSL K6-2862 TaxID=2921484 RepID=UPI0030F8B2B6
MNSTNLFFKIDTSSSLPINVQIKEQIKWLIGKDLLKPNAPLPSTNQLADELAINRNTIQWVYSQLKEEGLLVMQKGRGTQVAEEENILKFKQQNPYYSFVEQTINQAYESGYNVQDVLLSGFAYVQLFGQPLEKKLKYLFIECKTISCVFYLDEIRRVSPADIQTIDISSTEENLRQAILDADVVITVNDLAPQINQFVEASNKSVITVGSSCDVQLLLNMLIQ